MRVFFYILLVFILVENGNSQKRQIKEVKSFFSSGDYNLTISTVNKYIDVYPDAPEFVLYKGMALTEKEEFATAVPYLEEVIGKEKSLSDIASSWAFGYLACCHFILYGDEKAEETFEKAYNSNGTYEVEKFINGKLLLFGLEDFYEDWVEINTDRFNFWFEDTTGHDVQKFIREHELAYDSINGFFRSSLPKKIDFFVWNSVEGAFETLKTKPPFASPVFECIHTLWGQPVGHEITHVISHYSSEIKCIKKLIYEGVSVYFDFSGRNKEAFIKAYIRNKNIIVSIEELWGNWDLYPQELSYPIAGLFVEQFMEEFGREQFLKLFREQSLENARLLFGKELIDFIYEFEKKINKYTQIAKDS